MKFIKKNQGFTLVQLIVGVAIILILGAIVIFNEDPLARRGTAQDVRRHQDVEAIAKAVELYQNDNDSLPADIVAAQNIDTDQKYVLCSTESTLTCDGQSRTCRVLDDVDFLDNYLGGSLPVDPTKTDTTDTGYYISRNGDQMVFGACESYGGDSISYIVRAKVPPVCGNGIIEGDEACDDGENDCIGSTCCGNGDLEAYGWHCNSTCSENVFQDGNELCDYNPPFTDDCSISGEEFTNSDYGGPSLCNITCDDERSVVSQCDGTGID